MIWLMENLEYQVSRAELFWKSYSQGRENEIIDTKHLEEFKKHLALFITTASQFFIQTTPKLFQRVYLECSN